MNEYLGCIIIVVNEWEFCMFRIFLIYKNEIIYAYLNRPCKIIGMQDIIRRKKV